MFRANADIATTQKLPEGIPPEAVARNDSRAIGATGRPNRAAFRREYLRAAFALLISGSVSLAAVPLPWTSLKTEDSSIEVWGRTYTIGSDGLPVSIQSKDAELLSRPVRFRVNAETLPPDSGCTFGVASDESVEWEASAAWSGIDYRCHGRAEFDGMMRFDIEFAPRESSRPISLRLDLAMPREQATLLHFYPPLYDYPGMTWPKPDRPNSMARPPRWQSRFTPFIWLGNEQRGLQWFCESDEDWLPAQSDKALEIVEEGSDVVLRIRLMDKAISLTRPFRFTFGLMAGPVKPPPSTFRQGRFGYFHWASYDMADVRPGSSPPSTRLDDLMARGARFVGMHEDWTDFQGMPRCTQPQKLRQLVEQVHRRDMGLLLYHGMFMPDIAPEYGTMGAECAYEPQSAFYIHSREPKQRDYPACPQSRWSGLFTDGIERLFVDYGIDGVYLDGAASPLWCTNVRHGCGYGPTTAERRPTYPIFAMRDQMKRLRRICIAADRPTLIVAHMSGMVTLPTLSLADLLLTGEQWWKFPNDFRPTVEAFRAECMGHPHGIPTDFIGYPPLGGEWARTMIGLHHAPSSWCPGGVEMWKLYDTFDVDRAAWHPYWSDTPLAVADRSEVRVSGFLHPGKRALLAVGNTSIRPSDLRLTIRPDLLGVATSPVVIRDALTNDEMSVTAEGLDMHLAPESLRWLLFETKGSP